MSALLVRRFLVPTVLLALIVAPAAAQVFPFQIKIQQDDNLFSLSNGSGFNINAKAVGQMSPIHVTVTYRGFGSVELASAPALIGAPSLAVSAISGAPGTLFPGDNFKFDVNYTPTTSAAVSGQVELIYRETLSSGSEINPTPVVQPAGLILLGLVGTVPEFVVSYLLTTDANSIALTDGSKIVFPATPVNTSSFVQVSVANRGSGPGKLTGVTVSGATFQPLGLPLFPLSINANQQFNFNIRYTPRVVENSSGSLIVALDSIVFNLDLTGSSISTLHYRVTRGTQTTDVAPNQTISFDSTNPGETASDSIEVRNIGSTDVVISGISVTGTAFQLGVAPILPISLAPNAVTTLTVTFAPSVAGQFLGRLRIGNDDFGLSGIGVGPHFTFAYTNGANTVPVDSGGSIFFSPLQAGKTAQMSFTVNNTGPSPAIISNIGIQETNVPFVLSGLPSLPVTIPSGGSTSFSIAFSPITTGFATATLRLDARTFTLTGSGISPGPLPDYSFSIPSGSVAPAQQPTIGLTLAAPYPVSVTGVLTLLVDAGALPADPGVLFANGARTINFTIPANTTQAVFATGSSQIRFQTGSVASNLVLTPSFALQGGVDITPTSPSSLRLSVAASAPLLTGIQVTNSTATSFTVTITGLTTSRSLTKLDVTFTPTATFNFPTAQITLNIASSAALWFDSSQSQAFGGQFQISIPFTLTSNNSTPASGVAAINVTASNELGTSNSLVTKLQ